jgi:hypothetical protein
MKTFVTFAIIFMYGAQLSAQYVENPNIQVIDHRNFDTLSYREFEKKIKNIQYIPLITKKHIKNFSSIDLYSDNRIFIYDFAYETLKPVVYEFNGKGKQIGVKTYPVVLHSRMEILDHEGNLLDMVYPVLKREINRPATNDETSVTRQQFPFYHVYDSVAKGQNSLVLDKNFRNKLLFSKSLFPSVLSDTVYRKINDSLYMIEYIVEQEKSIWHKSNEIRTMSDCDKLQIESGYTYRTGDFLESANYVNYSVSYGTADDGIYPVSFWYDKRTKKTFTMDRTTQIQTHEPEDILNSSTIVMKHVTIYAPIHHIVPKPIEVHKNKYIGVFPRVKELKAALENPESFDSRYFKNTEVINMVTKTKNLEAILVIYELE